MRISDLLGEPDKRKPDTDDDAVVDGSPAAAAATEAAEAAEAPAQEAAMPDVATTAPAAGGAADASTDAVDVPKATDADRLSFGSALGSSEQRARGVQAGEAPETQEAAEAPAGLDAPLDDLLPDRNRKR